MPLPVAILQTSEQAAVLLDPQRLRLLNMLREPDSAAGLARRLQLPRQQVNYHLRALEAAHLVHLAGETRKGNCVERLLQATATSYLINPEVLGDLTPTVDQDKFSAGYLAATAARAIADLGNLQAAATKSGKKLATLKISTEVRFASPQMRAEFAAEISAALAAAAARYHAPNAPGGRTFRIMLGAYPAPTAPKKEHQIEHTHA